ncbi:S8 family peptidase [Cytophagales bacterium LB-30]|uniref:S8 family peptidase n=1 Tax=Shiella aurantiaca TaxID=3058365 RepID=A0ABT8F0X1_9BACT|nr:S8 family peptidase [Shiella aurantiaca]MDN4164048.1 S8 family peptidase [Shiella aurantiaca]
MAKKNKGIGILFMLFFSSSLALAQEENLYAVFFTDKENSTYSVNAPEAFLSEKAIARRAKQEIEVVAEDLPVNETYLQAVSEAGGRVLFPLKWNNACVVSCTDAVLQGISQLDVVSETRYLGPLDSQNSMAAYGGTKSYRYGVAANSLKNENQLNLLGIPRMHEQAFKGEGMIVAVFDGGFSGVDQIEPFSHLFTENLLVAARNFTAPSQSIYQYSDHGTRVLSTLTAQIRDEYQGIVPEAQIVLCVTEVVRSEYRVEEYYWQRAAEFSDSLGVDVINSSLGYNLFDDDQMNYTYEQMNGTTSVIAQAADWAFSKGMMVVVSAGNEGANSWKYITTPADAINVLAVGSLNPDQSISSFSSWGPSADNRVKPDVTCIGGSTQLVNSSGSITSGNGTSFASPQIAGLVTGLWQALPTLTAAELLQKVRETATASNDPNDRIGYGIPTFSRVFGDLINGLPEEVFQGLVIYPNPLNQDNLFLKIAPIQVPEAEVMVVNQEGKVLIQQPLSFENGESELALPELGQGVYLIRVQAGAQQWVQRLIKQ